MKKKQLKKLVKDYERNLAGAMDRGADLAIANADLKRENDALLEDNIALKNDVSKLAELTAFYGTTLAKIKEETEKKVFISGVSTDKRKKTTTVTWSDGRETTVKCDKEDEFDEQKGVLLCIAKEVMSYDEYGALVSGKYVFKPQLKDRKLPTKIYMNLSSSDKAVRLRAQKQWEKIPENVRQATKAEVRNKLEGAVAIGCSCGGCSGGCAHS